MPHYGGSNTTGAVAERMNRKWLAIDRVEDYLEGSKFRFGQWYSGRHSALLWSIPFRGGISAIARPVVNQ